MTHRSKAILTGASIIVVAIAVVLGVRHANGSAPAISDEPAKTKGAASAGVTIVEFSDFQCPFCGEMTEILDHLQDVYPNDVKIVYKHFPLDRIHESARLAAEASECAAEQGRFWEYHDQLFNFRDSWAIPVPEAPPINVMMKNYAKDLGLDREAFSECLDSGRTKAIVERNIAEARGFMVSGTPSLIFQGQRVVPSHDFEYLKDMVAKELKRQGKS